MPEFEDSIRFLLETERGFGVDLLPFARQQFKTTPKKPVVPQVLRREFPKEETPKIDKTVPAELQKIASEVAQCRKCHLHKTRTKTVFGVGNWDKPVLMFVGEGPGEDEDRAGEPFVGRAGQLLTDTLKKFGVARDKVYICNVVKCRAVTDGRNRPPALQEIQSCYGYLKRQIDFISPKYICALGAIAATTLLNKPNIRMGDFRGKFVSSQIFAAQIYVAYHPAYILRNMNELGAFEADIKTLLTKIGLTK